MKWKWWLRKGLCTIFAFEEIFYIECPQEGKLRDVGDFRMGMLPNSLTLVEAGDVWRCRLRPWRGSQPSSTQCGVSAWRKWPDLSIDWVRRKRESCMCRQTVRQRIHSKTGKFLKRLSFVRLLCKHLQLTKNINPKMLLHYTQWLNTFHHCAFHYVFWSRGGPILRN